MLDTSIFSQAGALGAFLKGLSQLRCGLAATFLVACASTASAYDIRKCPLDDLIYINTWDDEEFEVVRVGGAFYYVCGDGQELTFEPVDPDACRGPYGELILSGIYSGSFGTRPLDAIYSLQASGAPCCGWTVSEVDAQEERERPINWLSKVQVPRLGDWPLGAIDNGWGGPSDLNGMVPMICTEGNS